MSIESLEISDFVAESITQIAQGVAKAAENVEKLGGKVNPRSFSGGTNSSSNFVVRETVIEFDLVVGVEATKEGGAKAKIAVLGQGITGGGGISSKNHATNRISFKVVAQMPASQPLKAVTVTR
jgi:hypothetical protein